MIYYNKRILLMLIEQGLPISEAANRGTGRSTAQALDALGRATRHPGMKVLVQDHHSGDRTVALNTQHLIRSMADALKLQDVSVTLRDHKGQWYVEVVNNYAMPAGPVPIKECILA